MRRALMSLLLLVLTAGLAGGETVIDWSMVDRPTAIVVPDKAAELRWQALFAADPEWPERQAAFVARRLPDLAPTLFAARLLYPPEAGPWRRRSSDTIDFPLWRANDRAVRQAVLREIRWRRDAVYADLMLQVLRDQRCTDPVIAEAVLGTLLVLKPELVPPMALRLADPRLPDRLPLASAAPARALALRLLIDQVGIDDPLTRQALEFALLHAAGAERLAAYRHLVEQTGDAELLAASLVRLVAELRAGPLASDDAASLVLGCSALRGRAPPALAAEVGWLVVHGDRAVASAAAGALAARPPPGLPVAAIAARARDPDPVLRNAVLNLLLRLNPAATAVAAPGTPWERLASHRMQLLQWEVGAHVK
jgi:hypothetical protein